MPDKLEPIAPGEVLLHEFMMPLDVSRAKLARDLGVNAGRIGEVVQGRSAITADLALRLSVYFGTTPEFWLNLQSRYELKVAKRRVGAEIKRRVARLTSAA